MNNYYDKNKDLTDDDYVERGEYIKEVADGKFHIGQAYEDKVADTVVCAKCGGNSFHVGQGSYYTAIKCVTCEWELCIHDG